MDCCFCRRDLVPFGSPSTSSITQPSIRSSLSRRRLSRWSRTGSSARQPATMRSTSRDGERLRSSRRMRSQNSVVISLSIAAAPHAWPLCSRQDVVMRNGDLRWRPSAVANHKVQRGKLMRAIRLGQILRPPRSSIGTREHVSFNTALVLATRHSENQVIQFPCSLSHPGASHPMPTALEARRANEVCDGTKGKCLTRYVNRLPACDKKPGAVPPSPTRLTVGSDDQETRC